MQRIYSTQKAIRSVKAITCYLRFHDLTSRHYLSIFSQVRICNSQNIYLPRYIYLLLYIYFLEANLSCLRASRALLTRFSFSFKSTSWKRKRERHISHAMSEILRYQKVGGPQILAINPNGKVWKKYLVFFDTLLQYSRTTPWRGLHKNVWRVTRIVQKPTCRVCWCFGT